MSSMEVVGQETRSRGWQGCEKVAGAARDDSHRLEMHRRALSSWRSQNLSLKQLPRTIRSLLDESGAALGSTVTVNGWVRSIRRQKAIAFITVNDGSSVNSIQVVAPREVAQEYVCPTS